MVAESGTDFLVKLKTKADADARELVFVTMMGCSLSTAVFTVTEQAKGNLPGDYLAVVLWVIGSAVIWLCAAEALLKPALTAYKQHYQRILTDKGLLLKLMDTQRPDSFAKRTLAFLHSYSSLASRSGAQPYPAGWRIASTAVLAAAWFFATLFLFLMTSWALNLMQQLHLPVDQAMHAAYISVLLFLVQVILDRPRHIALRRAISEALLRHRDQQIHDSD